MPKTLIWHGAGDGNASTPGTYANAANWIDQSTGTAPGSGPASGDSFVFDRGNISIAPTATGHTIASWVTTPDWAGAVAPGGVLSATFTSIRHASGPANYAGNITLAKFAPRQGSKINYSAGTLAKAFLEHADFSAAADGIVTALRADSGSTIDDLFNGTGYTLAQLKGGSRLNTRRGGVINACVGCVAKILGAGVLADGSLIRSGAFVEYLSSAEIDGMVEVERNGTLTAVNNATAFSFSGTLAYWPGANYDLNTRAGLVTPSTLTAFGLSSKVDVGGFTPRP